MLDMNKPYHDLTTERHDPVRSTDHELVVFMMFYTLIFCRQGCRKVQLFCESQNIDCRNFGTCVNEWVGYWCDCNMTSYVRDSRDLCTQGMYECNMTSYLRDTRGLCTQGMCLWIVSESVPIFRLLESSIHSALMVSRSVGGPFTTASQGQRQCIPKGSIGESTDRVTHMSIVALDLIPDLLTWILKRFI